jgi:hypothetical protein
MSRVARGWRRLSGSAAFALSLLLVPQAQAAEQVDIELVLAVDVSLSMSPDELEIQRQGYAAALTHDRVLEAIAAGVHGRIAVTYVEWAGSTSQHIVVPWTAIATRSDAERFAGFRWRSLRRKRLSRHEAGHRHFRRRAQQSGLAGDGRARRADRAGHHH